MRTVSRASETANVRTLPSLLPNRQLTGASRANMDACSRPLDQSGWIVLFIGRPVTHWPTTSWEGRDHLSVKRGGGCGTGLVSLTATMSSPSAIRIGVSSRLNPFRSPSAAMSKPAALKTSRRSWASARPGSRAAARRTAVLVRRWGIRSLRVRLGASIVDWTAPGLFWSLRVSLIPLSGASRLRVPPPLLTFHPRGLQSHHDMTPFNERPRRCPIAHRPI